MRISKNKLIKYLDSLLTPSQFQDYCPNGLQVDGQEKISKIAFSVSATIESIENAISNKANALIVHHGLFWNYQGAKTITGAHGKRIKSLINNEINLFAYHLPLDANLKIGNASTIGKFLKLKKILPFGSYKNQPLGIKGNFEKPISPKSLKTKLEKYLSHSVILSSHNNNNNNKINSIGIITGGANNEWIQAKQDGLDAYLTGEISEYNWHDSKENEIHYFAGGHHATERPGILNLMSKVQKDLGVECFFIDSENLA
jgi:dinuclear metal center YbgI/SA1388 family protein